MGRSVCTHWSCNNNTEVSHKGLRSFITGSCYKSHTRLLATLKNIVDEWPKFTVLKIITLCRNVETHTINHRKTIKQKWSELPGSSVLIPIRRQLNKMENVTNVTEDKFTSLVTTIASKGLDDDTKYQCDLVNFVVRVCIMGPMIIFGFVGNTLAEIVMWPERNTSPTSFTLLILAVVRNL